VLLTLMQSVSMTTDYFRQGKRMYPISKECRPPKPNGAVGRRRLVPRNEGAGGGMTDRGIDSRWWLVPFRVDFRGVAGCPR
jgi:hypothetical protein